MTGFAVLSYIDVYVHFIWRKDLFYFFVVVAALLAAFEFRQIHKVDEPREKKFLSEQEGGIEMIV